MIQEQSVTFCRQSKALIKKVNKKRIKSTVKPILNQEKQVKINEWNEQWELSHKEGVFYDNMIVTSQSWNLS